MKPSLKKFFESIDAALPGNITEDAKRNLQAIIQGNLDKLDLVTREQFEVQEKVLARTRDRLHVLEKELLDLEARLEKINSTIQTEKS